MILSGLSKKRISPDAFSLVETLLAASIVSGALLTILGLFSSGLSIARESTRITYSALLARKVAEDLSYVPTVPVLSPDVFAVQPESSVFVAAKVIPVPVPVPQAEQPQVRLYNSFLESLGIISTSRDLYEQGTTDLNAVYLVLIDQVTRNDLGPGIKQLQINVEFPASAQAESRKVHRFSTLVHQP